MLVTQTLKFKRDAKRCRGQGWDMKRLEGVVFELASRAELESSLKDHKLKGEYLGYRECHVKDDWILVYRIEDNELLLCRTGTHEEVFH